MIGTISRAENNLFAAPPSVITLAAGVAQTVLASEQNLYANGEVAYRYIQNVGASELLYAIGSAASTVSYHGKLSAGAQLDCSAHRLLISCVSTAGTTVSTTVIYRKS